MKLEELNKISNPYILATGKIKNIMLCWIIKKHILAQRWRITHFIKTRNEEIILDHGMERGNINPRGRRHFIVIIYYGNFNY